MALHNLVFLVDVDYGDKESAEHLSAGKHLLKRGILQILLHIGYKYGFEKVRWGYKFFQSRSGRNASLISKGSDFKELRQKTYDDFEAEFETKFDNKDRYSASVPRPQSSRAAALQNALKETLLDFQWDRPDITSPTKLSLRPRKASRAGTLRALQEDEVSGSGGNVVFVVSECPSTWTQLTDYIGASHLETRNDVSDQILSKSIQDMLGQRQVVLHWVDTTSHSRVLRHENNQGSDQLSQTLAQVGGKVFPMVALLELGCAQKPETFTLGSSIGYLLSSEKLYRHAFPVLEGVLSLNQGDVTHSCNMVIEPVSRRQRLLPQPVEVCLKEVLQEWDTSALTRTSTESWVLRWTNESDQGAAVAPHILSDLFAQAVHMSAEVTCSGLVCSAVLSPLSQFTALLTVIQPEIAQHSHLLPTTAVSPVTAEMSADLPDVVNSVLGVVYNIMDEDGIGVHDVPKEEQVSEWAQQEVSQSPLTIGILESWFPHSDHSGVSSNLMESMRLLHAVPDQREEEESALQQEFISNLAELYETPQCADDKRGKKRGAHRTPVKQKMKTMSRSLQMLNVARLNVKAQKNQVEAEPPGPELKGSDKQGKKRSRKKPGAANSISFSSEAELLSHLKSSYEKAVAERDSSLLPGVQQLFSAVKTFFVAESDLQGKTSLFSQQHLLKTSKSIRQLYDAAADVESKVTECQLQVLLRLELCKLVTSEQAEFLDLDQMTEEVAEMLRIISLTKDPVTLTRFLQDEVLPGFLTAVPRVLADIYNSLGNQLPEALVAVLPADFFSDDSVAKDSVSPSASSPPLSTHSLVSDGRDRLQELRSRSAKKRRSGMLTRHRSMTESSQSLRQIEMPKKTTRASKSKVSAEVEKPVTQPPPPQQEKQEVTRVRRNLFNQESGPLSKKAKLPRSQSVSAVEGLKRKRSHESEEKHKLLTNKVCETPLHKQVSSRLLYRQKMGRRSAPDEGCIVEESPVKPPEDLRRSPRIQKFARRHSTTFYSSSQPRSRNLDRALSSSQLPLSAGKLGCVDIKRVQSPMRLLFGAADSPSRPSTSSEPARTVRTTRARLYTDSSVFESPNKTPSKHGQGINEPRTPRTPRTPTTPRATGMNLCSVAESPVAGSSREYAMALRGSPFRSPAMRTLVVETPTKQSPLKSPLKGILRTPVKTSGSILFNSPVSRTPRKSVTWSPSPRKRSMPENDITFKVPESPSICRSSPRFGKTPTKFISVESTDGITDNSKPPQKTRLDLSCHVPLSQISDVTGVVTQGGNLKPSEVVDGSPMEITPPKSTNLGESHRSPKTNSRVQAKTPSPSHQMITRSGRTPGKSLNFTSPCKLPVSPGGGTAASERLQICKTPPSKTPTQARSGQGATTTRQRARSQSSEAVSSDKTSKSVENCDLSGKQPQSDVMAELQAEPLQTSVASSHSDSQHLDSTTDNDSIEIVDASVVKAQFSGGLKMNISFSRKPSKSGEDFLSDTASPKSNAPLQGRSYGFRQTPDRQQREAAARLGYANDSPQFSTPRGPTRVRREKAKGTPKSLSYQVELEMQTTGLPKLKIKRTDSMNAGVSTSDGYLRLGTQSPRVSMKSSQLESPLALCPKQRDPGCISPSICAHVTPAKSTPGKGGSVQTYICQSYTPTRHHAGTTSPVATTFADLIPLTPSPQSRGKLTPENLNSWPRRKRAQIAAVGGKDRCPKGEPLLEELLEEAELGVSRLQDIEDHDEPAGNKTAASARANKRSPSVAASASPLSPPDDLNWIERLAQEADFVDAHRGEEETGWAADNSAFKSKATPPSSKVRKPVTASGILALTHSPLLFKGKTGMTNKRTPNLKDVVDEPPEKMVDMGQLSPFNQRVRHSNSGKSCSRKRLLH